VLETAEKVSSPIIFNLKPQKDAPKPARNFETNETNTLRIVSPIMHT